MVDFEKEFPFVNFEQKSKNVLLILEDSYVDGEPVMDLEKLDGKYEFGIHKKIFNAFSDEYDMDIYNKIIKMRRKK